MLQLKLYWDLFQYRQTHYLLFSKKRYQEFFLVHNLKHTLQLATKDQRQQHLKLLLK